MFFVIQISFLLSFFWRGLNLGRTCVQQYLHLWTPEYITIVEDIVSYNVKSFGIKHIFSLFWPFKTMNKKQSSDFFERASPPLFISGRNEKKNRTVFWSKTGRTSQNFIKNFVFFRKFKLIHWSTEKIFNFLSMAIIVFDVLNNELRWNSLKNYKLREIFECCE